MTVCKKPSWVIGTILEDDMHTVNHRPGLRINQALGAFAALFLASSCRTTEPQAASIDRSRGEVAFYSSGDKRTTLDEPDKQEQLRAVVARLKAQLKSNRNDVDALISLSRAQVALGDLENAEKNCRTVLRIDLKNPEAKKTMAEIAMRRGNNDLAAIFLTGIGGTGSKDSSVLNMLAMIELGHGNNAGAMALFKRAISLNPGDLAARMNLGVLLLKYRQLDQAAVEFERVLRAAPGHTDAKLHLAVIKAARGEVGQAEVMLKDVLKGDEGNPLALFNLAVVLRDQGKYDDAMDTLKSYLKAARGKAKDSDKVMALIDDIQKRQAANGERVSDEDIQAMAMTAGRGDADGSAARPKTAAAPRGAKAAATGAKRAKPAAPRAKSAPALAIPDDNGSAASDDIGDLEKALK